MLSPSLLFVLAVLGAVGMVLLLPGRKEAPLGYFGGAVLVAVAVIFATQVGRFAVGIGVYFWIFSAIALLGAVRVITHTRPVYSALYFVLTVMASAGLFVLMWAEFMAAALILIYAGAILVTYVFVIMLAAQATVPQRAGEERGHERLAEHDTVSREPVLASAVGFALMGVLLFVIFDRGEISRTSRGEGARTAAAVMGKTELSANSRSGTEQLGEYLFRGELVNLELAGLILTVAMVGAIIIARRRVWKPAAIGLETPGEMMVAPATPIDDNPHSIPVYGTENPRQKAYPET